MNRVTRPLNLAIRFALQAGGVFSVLAWSHSAWAETAPCFTTQSKDMAEQHTRLVLPMTQSLCIRDVHEGRAAVLLPDANSAIDDVVLAKGLSAHRWGFLDNRGQLVIKPTFEQVGDFHYALAAAMQNGKWGFIDTTGNWVIQPVFDEVQPFTQAELTVATRDNKIEVINRKGEAIGQPLDTLVDDAQISDGNPVRLRLSYKTVLLSPDGRRHVANDKMEIVEPFTHQGLFIARDADKGYGIADDELAWHVQPQFSAMILSDVNSSLVLAKSNDGITLIRADGSVVEQKYQSVTPLNGQFWLAKTADKTTLLDNNAAPISDLNESQVAGLNPQGDFLLDSSGKEALNIYIAGRKQPLALPAGSKFYKVIDGYLLTQRDDENKVNAIITQSAAMIGGTQTVGWLTQISQVETIDGRLWLHDNDGKLLNIVDAKGKALLSQKTLSTLAGYHIQPLISAHGDGVSAPLALIRPIEGSDKTAAGFVRADGSLQLEAKWQDIEPADNSENVAGGLAQHFIVKTAQGTGIVDAQGKTLMPLTQDNIAPFIHGYAFDYLNGKLSVIDVSGKHFALPDFFELESIGDGWFRYRETAADGALWGIYDVLTQKIIVPPSYQSVGSYANGLADVQQPDGLWGMLDQQGKLLTDAKYASIRRINTTLWKGTLPVVSSENQSSVPASQLQSELIGNDGKVRIGLTSGLMVTQFNDGRLLATLGEGQSWLLNSQGNVELHEQQTKITAVGNWVKLSRQPQEGYLNAQGNWQIPLTSSQNSAFVNGRALRTTSAGTELIDDKGTQVATLPAGQWYWPLASDMAIAYDNQPSGTMTRYVGSSGKPTLTVQGEGSRMLAGKAVLTRADGSKTWIDAQGHPAANVNYSDLGVVSEGLAFAEVGSHYGYLDANGNFVIPPVFRAVSAFDNGAATVSTSNTSMLIDSTGKLLARVDNECGVRVLYGAGSQRLWPEKMPVRCQE